MFPLAQGGHDFKSRKREDTEMVTDLLWAELVLPSIESMQSQLGDNIVWEKHKVAEGSLDLDLGSLCLVFVLLVTTGPLANHSSLLIHIFLIFRTKIMVQNCCWNSLTLPCCNSRWRELILFLSKWRELGSLAYKAFRQMSCLAAA